MSKRHIVGNHVARLNYSSIVSCIGQYDLPEPEEDYQRN